MRAIVSLFTLIILTTGAGLHPACAQGLETGTWTGLMVSPGRQPFETAYDVRTVGDSLQVTMAIDGWTTAFPFRNVRLRNDRLSFFWTPAFRVDCLLQRFDGVFHGACKDERGNLGPLIMAPPGVAVDTGDIDLEKAFSAWRLVERRAEIDAFEGRLGRHVDVGGYGLNVHATGAGDVTVVLEAGLGDPLRTWDYVQIEVDDFARVVSYDRAGIGLSDASPAERTPEQVARELHAALKAVGASPPYVLAGHAAGTLFVRTFAALYPDEVGGLVLVDPDHEQEGRRWRALDAASWDAFWTQRTAFFEMAPGPLRDEFDVYRRVIEAGELPLAGASLPDVPTVVVTSMRPVEEPRWVFETEAGQQVRHELHRRWIEPLRAGTHLVTTTSGRYVQREEPELVIEAIRRVVEAVRPTLPPAP